MEMAAPDQLITKVTQICTRVVAKRGTKKIYARNALERKWIHSVAKTFNLVHVTLKDPTNQDRLMTPSARERIEWERREGPNVDSDTMIELILSNPDSYFHRPTTFVEVYSPVRLTNQLKRHLRGLHRSMLTVIVGYSYGN